MSKIQKLYRCNEVCKQYDSIEGSMEYFMICKKLKRRLDGNDLIRKFPIDCPLKDYKEVKQ